jgi:hypothetical protein
MQDNKYEPPQADLDANTATKVLEPGWFNKRPIPVFIIAGLCILQFVGICFFMAEHWREITELVRAGVESPIAFLAKLLYPFVLLMAGVLLLLMRKAATYAFGIYLCWRRPKIDPLRAIVPTQI